jgi:predicted  nucleic acid-binding Zn-ribbon protein
MDPTAENVNAMKTQKCPRCGGRLFQRRIQDDQGKTSEEFFELFDIYGHSFTYPMTDILKTKEKK